MRFMHSLIGGNKSEIEEVVFGSAINTILTGAKGSN